MLCLHSPFLLAVLFTFISRSFASPISNTRIRRQELSASNTVTDPDAIVDLSNVPECAVANCVTSQSWIPSRIGCKTGILTRECFCETAITPLTCAPNPPNDNDNCFYELQTWFAGICGSNFRVVDLESIPSCGRNCTDAMITDQGCPDGSLNCVCQREEVYNLTASCLQEGCRNTNVFTYLDETPEAFAFSWYSLMCKTGEQKPFESDYQKWVDATEAAAKESDAARDKRIGLGVGLTFGLIFLILVVLWIATRGPECLVCGITCPIFD